VPLGYILKYFEDLKRGINADIGRKTFFEIAYNITLRVETSEKEDDHSMKFFIDTANIDEIKEANAMGMVDGVTTNPTLIAREKGEFKDIIAEICRIVDGPISAEVISLATDGMVDEARALAKIHDNIVVKIPMTTDGLKAVRILASEGIHTNVTLVFSALQALMAAKAGASYVSPFVGRLDDLSQEGMQLIEQVADIYSNYAYDTEIIVASIRNPMHVLDAALIGADIATIPFNVLKKLAAHPLTDKGIDAFLNDWKKKDH
jgi:transaldolase